MKIWRRASTIWQIPLPLHPHINRFDTLVGKQAGNVVSRGYLTSEEAIDFSPDYPTMVPDEPDVLGVEYIKLLKQEIKEQSCLESVIANGSEQVEEYCRIGEPFWRKIKKHIKGKRASTNIVKAFSENKYDITKPMATGVLFKLLRKEKYEVGWKFSSHLISKKVFEYEEMDRLFQIAFAALADFDKLATNLFENMLRIYRTQRAFHVFMASSALKRRNRVRMEVLFKELKEKNWYTDPFALNQMMLLYHLPDLRKRVPILFEEAKSLGVHPDIRSYNIYLGCCSSDKDISHMEEVFDVLKDDRNVEPDESTYIILACGYISTGNFEKAGKVLLDLEEGMESGRFKRKQSTYNKLLRLYGDTKDAEGVESVWEILNSRPLKAIETYGYAIEAFGKAVGVKQAEQIFADLDGLRETSQVISMMSVYTNHGYMEKAKDLFQSLPRKRMKHRLIVYRYMIAGYLRDGQPKKALQIFNMGCTVLRHRCKCKSWERVLHAVLDYFANRGDVQMIEKIFETNAELKEYKGVKVYRIMLKAYLNQKAPLHRFMDWITKFGFSLDSETRQLLMLLRNPKKK